MRKSSPFDKVHDVQSVAQLRALRRDDSSISEVLLSCSYVFTTVTHYASTNRHAAVYILENGTSVHWRKLGIEGFFYLVRRYGYLFSFCWDLVNHRDTPPLHRLILKNQTDSGDGDFSQSLDGDIRFEVKEGTFFYQ